MANETHGTICLNSSERDEKVPFILPSENPSLETACVSNLRALLIQLFRWIEASSQSFPSNNKGLTLSKQTAFLNPLVMPPKKV